MSYLKASVPDRLTLPSDPEYWVRMKPVAKQGDAEAAQAALMEVNYDLVEAARTQMAGNGSNGAAQIAPTLSKLEWQAYTRTLALRLIVEWNLTDEKDELLDINEASFAELDPEDAQYLLSEAQKRLRRRRPEREVPFEKQSSQLSRVLELQTPKQRKR